jgi:hypothetical protein
LKYAWSNFKQHTMQQTIFITGDGGEAALAGIRAAS